jgi:Tfp pilus assembly protein PilO
MKFNKLSKEKKNQLVLVALITVMLLVGLGYGLIRFQLEYVKTLQTRKAEADVSYKKMITAINGADVLNAQVEAAARELFAQEEGMIFGDKFSWLVSNLKATLRAHPKLDVPDFSTITEENCTLLAKFPYTQVTINIKGTGYFHDIGKFLAEFENDHPHFRVVNLELEPAQPGTDKERSERLQFKFSVCALVKPS